MSVPSTRISSLSPLLLVTNRISPEEVCLSSYVVLNCWLNLAAGCLDDENEHPLKVIATFSAINFFNGSPQLGDICLLVQGHNKISQFFPFVLVDAVLDVIIPSWRSGEVGSLLRKSSRLVITSNISAGTGSSWSLCRPVGMWCDTALSRTIRNIFSSLWQSVGRERLLRAASTSCQYLSQLSFFRLI